MSPLHRRARHGASGAAGLDAGGHPASDVLDAVVRRLTVAGLLLRQADPEGGPTTAATASIRGALDELDLAVREVHLSAFASVVDEGPLDDARRLHTRGAS